MYNFYEQIMMKHTHVVNRYEVEDNPEVKAFSQDKPLSLLEKNTNHYSVEKHVCNTCDQEIDSEISRILIMRNIDGGPRLLCFHFFFPCWDLELLVQKYPNLTIDKVAFSFPENWMINENSISDMKKNLEYWS